jgi:hypothetical protein
MMVGASAAYITCFGVILKLSDVGFATYGFEAIAVTSATPLVGKNVTPVWT